MRIYLQKSLTKSEEGQKSSGQNSVPQKKQQQQQQGEQRGGNYAARIQTGYEKDGSPKYKYFDTLQAKNKYLQNKGNSQKKKQNALKNKVDKEREDHKEKQESSSTSAGLFVRDKSTRSAKKKANKESDSNKVKKSVPMFIWRFE